MHLSLLATLCAATLAMPDRGPVLVISHERPKDPEILAMLESLSGAEGGVELFVTPDEVAAEADGFARRIQLPPEEKISFETRELSAAVREASAIGLRGPRFMDWYEALFPSDGPARLAHALYNAHAMGVPIISFGPIGSFVSGAGMAPREEWKEVERDPHEDATTIALSGLAVGPPAIVDARNWTVGDPVELLLAMHETKIDFGIFLEGEVALLCEAGAGRMLVIGTGRAVVFDLDGSRRRPRQLLESRVSVLQGGDAIDLLNFKFIAAEGAREIEPQPGGPDEKGAAPLAAAFLAAVGGSPRAPAGFTIEERGLEFELHADEDTALFEHKDGRRTLIGLSFDSSWD